MTRRQKFFLASAVIAFSLTLALAQRFFEGGNDDREQRVHETEGDIIFQGGRMMRTRGVRFDEDTVTTARAVTSHSTDLPVWTNAPGFERDGFTFCRLRYVSAYWGRRRSLGSWSTDF